MKAHCMARRLSIAVVISVTWALPAPVAGQTPAPAPRAVRPAPPPAPIFGRVFVNVNGALHASELTFTDSRTDPFFQETASWTADYAVESGPAFTVNGGVRLWGPLVARVGYSRFTSSNVAAIAGAVPHPFFFDRDRSIAGGSRALKQEEQAIHLGALWLVPLGNRLEIGIFGGPSLFRVRRDLIEDVRYSDSYPYDSAEFDSTLIRTVEDDRLGFHVGADLSWFFTRTLGVGTVLTFSRARLDLTSPATGRSVSIDAGGFQAGAGIRLRFGGRAPSAERRRKPSSPRGGETPPESGRPRPRLPAHPATAAPVMQEARTDARVTAAAAVFIAPDSARQPLAMLEPGTRVTVLQEDGEWLMVEFPDRRWGPRVGWILTKHTDW